MKSLAERIKEARIKAGLTQVQLAELTGFKQEYISHLESGGVQRLYKANKIKLTKILDI